MPAHHYADSHRQEHAFWRHLARATPVLGIVSLLTLALHHFGWMRGIETAALDLWLRLKEPLHAQHVVIVGITDADYRDIFDRKSPLAEEPLRDILAKIAAGQPMIIGVDLDTSDTALWPQDYSSGEWPPIVWARELRTEGERAEPRPVLGKDKPSVPSGIATLPQDHDGLVRRYRRVVSTEHGDLPSFPWAVVRAFCRSLVQKGEYRKDGRLQRAWESCESHVVKQEHLGEEEFILHFVADRYYFLRRSIKEVLNDADGQGWSGDLGPLRGKIVLLGGRYREARDTYLTPVGVMAGVDLMAQAIESELQGGGIHHANEGRMLLLELLTGVILIWLHYQFALGTALLLSLVAIPLLALMGSLVAFSTSALWVNFMPLLMSVLIHQLYDHAREYRRMYLALQERERRLSSWEL